jgi:hypothetical protein
VPSRDSSSGKWGLILCFGTVSSAKCVNQILSTRCRVRENGIFDETRSPHHTVVAPHDEDGYGSLSDRRFDEQQNYNIHHNLIIGSIIVHHYLRFSIIFCKKAAAGAVGKIRILVPLHQCLSFFNYYFCRTRRRGAVAVRSRLSRKRVSMRVLILINKKSESCHDVSTLSK